MSGTAGSTNDCIERAEQGSDLFLLLCVLVLLSEHAAHTGRASVHSALGGAAATASCQLCCGVHLDNQASTL